MSLSHSRLAPSAQHLLRIAKMPLDFPLLLAWAFVFATFFAHRKTIESILSRKLATVHAASLSKPSDRWINPRQEADSSIASTPVIENPITSTKRITFYISQRKISYTG